MPKSKVEKSEKKSDSKLEKQKELQRKYLQFQVLRQQLVTLIEERTLIEARLNELHLSIDAVAKLPKIAKGEEIWSSLGSGAFVLSDIKDVQKVIVSLGSGVFAKKPITAAKDLLERRQAELDNLNKELLAEIGKINQTLVRLEPELQRLAQHAE